MKAVLISIRPEWVEKILNGEKTIEVRKTVPKLETPFKCYIYCTYGNKRDNYSLGKRGLVVGEFICDEILPIEVLDTGAVRNYNYYHLEETQLSIDSIAKYISKNKTGYGWHISNLKIYDKPKHIIDFAIPCKRNEKCDTCRRFMGRKGLPVCNDLLLTSPQSWCYVKD